MLMSSTFVVSASSRYPLMKSNREAAVSLESRWLIRATPCWTIWAPKFDLSFFGSKPECCFCCCVSLAASFGVVFLSFAPFFLEDPPNPPLLPPPKPLLREDFDLEANREALSSCFHIFRRFASSISSNMDCSDPDNISSSITAVGVEIISATSVFVVAEEYKLPAAVLVLDNGDDENADAAGRAMMSVATTTREITPSSVRILLFCL
mmetsp:Transcript_1021/g.2364  ORF Transcript_1021/g.2364 Transcript_1021/m.2364 type:complete len:208 (-) Transcript_1021:125-748(-)